MSCSETFCEEHMFGDVPCPERKMIRKSDLTNEEVAALFDIHPTAASRWRSGSRVPSVLMMRQIREIFSWSVDGQADSVASGRWHERFEYRLRLSQHELRVKLAAARRLAGPGSPLSVVDHVPGVVERTAGPATVDGD